MTTPRPCDLCRLAASDGRLVILRPGETASYLCRKCRQQERLRRDSPPSGGSDLLTALENVVAAWDRDYCGEVPGEYIEAARAAIAKAKGESA